MNPDAPSSDDFPEDVPRWASVTEPSTHELDLTPSHLETGEPVVVDSVSHEPTPHIQAVSYTDPWSHRRGEPRTFAALWIIFLFAIAVLSIANAGLVGLVAIDVYRSVARIMLCVTGAALAFVWPMVRLSQEPPNRPARAAVQDLFVVGVPVQALVWPQYLPWMAGWPLPVVGELSLVFGAWTILLAGILGVFWDILGRTPHTPRWLLMLVIVILVMGPPAARLLAGSSSTVDSHPLPADALLLASPLTCTLEIGRDTGWSGHPALAQPEHRLAGYAILVACLPVWGYLLARRPRYA